MQQEKPLPTSLIIQYVIARRNVIDMIDAGIAYYRNEFAAFAGLTFLVWVPYYSLKYIMFRLDLLPFERITGSFDFFQTASYSGINILFLFMDYSVMLAAGGLIGLMVFLKASGNQVSFLNITRSFVKLFPRFLLYSTIIAFLILISGMCLFPALWLFVFFILSTPILVIEQPVSFGLLIRRNRHLMKREWFRSLGFFLLTFLLLLILGISLTYLFYGLYQIVIEQISWISGIIPDYDLLDMFSGAIITLLLFPLQTIFNMFLYFDIRSRKEGFDLEFLVNRLRHNLPENKSN